MENLLKVLKALPGTFIPLFVAIDVFIILPIFISLTEGMPAHKRKTIIRQSTITALVVSFAFVALGEATFKILNITVDDFKIAGGLVLLILAVLDLIRHEEKKKPVEVMGVVPIGVPLIVGPAVLTTLLVLVDHYGILPTSIALIMNLIIVWLAFTYARSIIKTFGKSGIAAISKIMALLLASIAVMMIRIGIENIISRD